MNYNYFTYQYLTVTVSATEIHNNNKDVRIRYALDTFCLRHDYKYALSQH